MPIRKANIKDAKLIHKLINDSSRNNEMLPRSLNDIYEHIRDFFVYEKNGALVGACSLHIVWENLAEIRSLYVQKSMQGKGIGTTLVRKSIADAKKLGIDGIFALTYRSDFFKSLGFKIVDKSKLPHKIWGDCIKCPKFPDCDEVALVLKLK